MRRFRRPASSPVTPKPLARRPPGAPAAIDLDLPTMAAPRQDLGALALDTVVSLAAATVVGVSLVAVFL